MVRQRILGIAALLAIGALMAGVPWLFLYVATRVRVRFDLTTLEGWWQAITTRDDGTLLVWIGLIIGTLAWVTLVIAIVVEIVNRVRGVRVPELRGLGIPQAVARGLVAAAIGAWLATNTITTGALHAIADPGSVPVDTGGAPTHVPAAPQAQPAAKDEDDVYVVKKGDTLWDIADDRLGDPYAYPDIYKASRHTVQPDGRRLVDPDLIYPGWKLTIPDDDPPEDAPTPKRAAAADPEEDAQATAAAVPVPATPSASPTPPTAAEPTATATPVVEPETAEPSQDAADIDETAPLPWMLAGIGGAGALLSGAMWFVLRRRRAAQFRNRRVGHTVPVPLPDLAPVEQTLMHQGDLTSDLVGRVHDTMQRLALQLHTTDQPIPLLVAIDATYEHLTFHFDEPTELTEPWQPGADPRQWRIAADADPDLVGPQNVDREPVWPLLVTIGQDAQGWRLVNLEAFGMVTLTGNQVNAEDLARYCVAELAMMPWGRDLDITVHGAFEELRDLNPPRMSHLDTQDSPIRLIADAADTHHWIGEYGADRVDIARARQDGPDLWLPRLLVTGAPGPDRLDELARLVAAQPARTGVTVILIGGEPPPSGGLQVTLTDDGRVQIPSLGLDAVANGITRDEAEGCTAVLTTADGLRDAPVPDVAEPAGYWQQFSDAAGHLHADVVIPRGTLGAIDARSVLPDPNVVYVTEAATTPDDLAEMAPLVPAETATRVTEADPSLDQDLADWWADSCDRPRISVLGPVRLRLGSGGQPTVGLKRVPFYTEIVAYLATRPHGATTEELAGAFGVDIDRPRHDLAVVRARLGTNPRTGRPHLPKSAENDEADRRGVGVYLLEDVLSDADLFRRLRQRGEASTSIDDLAEALRLVNGAPYDQLRRRGGLWLGHTHDDHHLTAGIVDLAHLLTTRALAAGDLKRARAAAELAHAVSLDEDIPRLDLAKVAEREGNRAEADRFALEVIDWTDFDGLAPVDASERTNAILRAHRWLERKSPVV